MNYKEPTFENVYVGETFGPLKLTLDPFFLKSYAYATDDYTGMTVAGGQIVPGAAIVSELMLAFLSACDPDGVVGLRQKEEAEYFAQIAPGTTLTITGKYIAKYEKRGKGYVALESEARDESGKLVTCRRSTEIMRIPEGVQVGRGAAVPDRKIEPRTLGADRVARIDADTTVGSALAPVTKSVCQAQMSVFSGADIHRQGIYTVRMMARAAGLSDCIAQGMMESCWASEFLTRSFGPAFPETGRHSTVYISPVFPHDTIICEGIENGFSAEGGTKCIEVEYWFTNQNFITAAVGFCSAEVPA